jgi:hypothetical protein
MQLALPRLGIVEKYENTKNTISGASFVGLVLHYGSGCCESLGDRAFPRDQRRIEKKAPMKKALYGFPQLQ